MTLGALQTLDSRLSQRVSPSALSGWPNLGLLLPTAWAAWCRWGLWKGPLWCGTEASLSSWWWSRLVTADTRFASHKTAFTYMRLRVSVTPRLHGEPIPLLYLLFLNWYPLSISILIRKLTVHAKDPFCLNFISLSWERWKFQYLYITYQIAHHKVIFLRLLMVFPKRLSISLSHSELNLLCSEFWTKLKIQNDYLMIAKFYHHNKSQS